MVGRSGLGRTKTTPIFSPLASSRPASAKLKPSTYSFSVMTMGNCKRRPRWARAIFAASDRAWYCAVDGVVVAVPSGVIRSVWLPNPHVDNQLCKGIICIRKISHLIFPSSGTSCVFVKAAVLFVRRALRRNNGRCCRPHAIATSTLSARLQPEAN